jgi:formamidopyrimidine-DNA glycosylase
VVRRKNLRRPFPPAFASRLKGRRIRSVDRRGKYLLVALDSGDTLLMHLGIASEALHLAGLSPLRRASTLVAGAGRPTPGAVRL